MLALIAAGIVVLLGAVTGGLYLLNNGNSDVTATIGTAHSFVTAKFQAGAMHFGPTAETSVVNEADGSVKVSGNVDVVLADGHSQRYAYTVTMHRGPDGDWIGDDVNLLPM